MYSGNGVGGGGGGVGDFGAGGVRVRGGLDVKYCRSKSGVD